MSLSGLWPPSRRHTIHLRHPSCTPTSIGHITGLTFLTHPKKRTPSQPRAHYFGGIPYALPPRRFTRAIPLPQTHNYGTPSEPGIYIGEVGVCPQPGNFGDDPVVREVEDGNLPPEDWDEMCLQCNIWVPVGEPPRKNGWPVLVFFHGGFLQFGSPNGSDCIGLTETPGKCIIVLPGYRVNVFGFLASKELEDEGGSAGNYGFWDQRLALEWTRDRIAYFGGDPGNMTIGGYSAGALSTFHQLSYDFGLPPSEQLTGIKRAMLLSNGTGIQPRTIIDAQDQYCDLLSALDISPKVSAKSRLARLRAVPALTLVNATLRIPRHEFRHVTDDAFVSASLFTSLEDGTWAAHLKSRNITLLISECQDEHFAFATWHPLPADDNTHTALRTRLAVDYPAPVINALFPTIYFPGTCATLRISIRNHLTEDENTFFGHIYADIQVHGTQRGFVRALYAHGAGHLVRRCVVNWRAKRADKNFPREMGCTHGTDTALWFWGDGVGVELLKSEEGVARGWCEGFWSWIVGVGVDGSWEGCGWEEMEVDRVRYIDGDGVVSVVVDQDWKRGCKIWDVIRGVQMGGQVGQSGWLRGCVSSVSGYLSASR